MNTLLFCEVMATQCDFHWVLFMSLGAIDIIIKIYCLTGSNVFRGSMAATNTDVDVLPMSSQQVEQPMQQQPLNNGS